MCDDNAHGGILPPNPLDDPENRRRIASLEREIEDFTREQKDVETRARELMARELAGEGPFAQEIFQLKQRKMVLLTQAQANRARINQILWGII